MTFCNYDPGEKMSGFHPGKLISLFFSKLWTCVLLTFSFVREIISP